MVKISFIASCLSILLTGGCWARYQFPQPLFIPEKIDLRDLEKLNCSFRASTKGYKTLFYDSGSGNATIECPIKDAQGYFTEVPVVCYTPYHKPSGDYDFIDRHGNTCYWAQRLELKQYSTPYHRRIVPVDPYKIFPEISADCHSDLSVVLAREYHDKTLDVTTNMILPIDTWGTPIMQYDLGDSDPSFFGAFEGTVQYEYRSAGPDRTFYTEDDIVASKNMPPQKAPHRVKDLRYFQLPLDQRGPDTWKQYQ